MTLKNVWWYVSPFFHNFVSLKNGYSRVYVRSLFQSNCAFESQNKYQKLQTIECLYRGDKIVNVIICCSCLRSLYGSILKETLPLRSLSYPICGPTIFSNDAHFTSSPVLPYTVGIYVSDFCDRRKHNDHFWRIVYLTFLGGSKMHSRY